MNQGLRVMAYKNLNPEKALIWRMVHRDNLAWLLDNGLHCGNSPTQCPGWISIGNPDLTERRATHPVPLPPGGFLNDYIPFYFTPFSPMLLNIISGRGVPIRTRSELVFLVSSIHLLHDRQIPFLFTDSHAYYQWTNFYSSTADLVNIDWPLLQARNFKHDREDPGKFERYQAEALVHRHLPIDGLLGILCYDDNVAQHVQGMLTASGYGIPVHARPKWYF